MSNKIIFPSPVTEVHSSVEYLDKLSGKNIVDMRNGKRSTYKIIHIIATGKLRQEQRHPSFVKYKTDADSGETTLDWPIAIMLIEGIYAQDNNGFEYHVIS